MSKDRISSLNEKVGSVRNLISNFETSTEVAPQKNDLKAELFDATEQRKPVEGSTSDLEKQSPKHIEKSVLVDKTSNKNINANDKIFDSSTDYQDSIKSNQEMHHLSTEKNIDFLIGEPAKEVNAQNIRKEFSPINAMSNQLNAEVVSNVGTGSSFHEQGTIDSKTQKLINFQNISLNSASVNSNDPKTSNIGEESISVLENFNNESDKNQENLKKYDETIENKNDVIFNNEDDIFIEFDNNSIQNIESYDWKFGDIDGLDKFSFSTTHASSNSNIINNKHNPTNTCDGIANNDKSVPSIEARNRSVSFKDSFPEKTPPFLKTSSTKAKNPWKYILYGLVAGIVIIYVITLTYKEVFISQRPVMDLTENDLFQYFEKSTTNTRVYLLNKLARKYNINLEEETNDNNFERNLRKKTITYTPREGDSDVLTVYNVFENINSEYQDDLEVKNLMQKDNLKFIFSGISYAPEHVIEPKCGATLRNVILDIARLSKITGRVRTYGTQCNQCEYILQAIDDLQVNMTLSMGVWIGNDDSINQKQFEEMKRLLELYPRKYFHSIFIGNEVIYRGDKTVAELLGYIESTKLYLKSLGITDLPVGTSEIGSEISEEMFKHCDFVGANIHPFFGGVSAQFGTRWVLDYFYNQLLPLRDKSNPATKLIISEVGWPYQGGEFIRASAGSWEFQQFLNDWVCTSPAEILNDCFYFEAFDEPWKRIWWDDDRIWETEWGFFDSQRNMKKHVYIPDCSKYGNPSMVDFRYIEDVNDPYADGNNQD